MNFLKRLAAATLALVCICSLTGCLFDHSYEPTQSGIYVASDRTIKSAEITELDNSDFSEPRYTQQGLSEFVKEAVCSYNESAAGVSMCGLDDEGKDLPVLIDSLSYEGTKATLIMSFESASTYLDFFGTTQALPVKELIVGDVEDGVNSGLTFDAMLDADGHEVSAMEITKHSEYMLIYISGSTEIQTQKKIAYYSRSITLKDEYTAVIDGGSGYIIFK